MSKNKNDKTIIEGNKNDGYHARNKLKYKVRQIINFVFSNIIVFTVSILFFKFVMDGYNSLVIYALAIATATFIGLFISPTKRMILREERRLENIQSLLEVLKSYESILENPVNIFVQTEEMISKKRDGERITKYLKKYIIPYMGDIKGNKAIIKKGITKFTEKTGEYAFAENYLNHFINYLETRNNRVKSYELLDFYLAEGDLQIKKCSEHYTIKYSGFKNSMMISTLAVVFVGVGYKYAGMIEFPIYAITFLGIVVANLFFVRFQAMNARKNDLFDDL
jgi:hypothetical protein